MSTIASPRDSPAPHSRRMNSSQALVTPTSSNRPSLELSHSASGSPNPNASSNGNSNANPTPNTKRANRAALREYYNLQKAAAANNSSSSQAGTPTLEITSGDSLPSPHPIQDSSSYMPPSELDAPNFQPQEYIAKTLSTASLSELLKSYTKILGEIRALDAEKKALVYDNYSKLISATETIRKMRSNMDPLNPMASTLDLVVAKIYEQASGIREDLRRGVPPPSELETASRRWGGGGDDGKRGQEEEQEKRRAQTRQLAVEVLKTPERLRMLMDQGKEEEARKQWEMPRRLLERWKEKGLGGRQDVDELLREGDEIVGIGVGSRSPRVSGDGEGSGSASSSSSASASGEE